MLRRTIIVLCVVYYVVCQLDIGDPCTVSGSPGICKTIYECEYAKKILFQDEKKPTTCNIIGTTRIVCCPIKDLFHETGVFRQHFYVTDHGVKRSRNITCRYDGKQPLLCCENFPDLPLPPEPYECPRFATAPSVNASLKAERIAWKKCLDYRQFLYKCVSSQEDPDNYERINTCGIPSVSRIAEGYKAAIKEFPHMAVLGCHNAIPTEDVDIIWIGGGTLISDKYILTAGHVLGHLIHGRIQYALLGALNKKDLRSGAFYNIIRRIYNDNYNPTNKAHDIALLELDRRVKLSEFIRPACLPVPGMKTTSALLLAGWGQTEERGPTSDVLLTTGAKLEPAFKCKGLNQKNFVWDSERMYCASGVLRDDGVRSDSCHGDSGGPLMTLVNMGERTTCTYVVKGIVSFGPECGKGAAAVYTNVAPYLDWIVKNVWTEEYEKE